ncbi:MAG: GAF domain-containing protein, partial [Cyanobacteria bacterium J06632_3]
MSLASTDTASSHLGDILGQLILRVCKAQSEAEIYTVVAKDLPLLIPAERVSVALLTHSRNDIEVFALEGPVTELAKSTCILCTQQSYIGYTILTQKNTLATAAEDSIYPDLAHLASEGLISVMTAPLLVSGEAIGALNVGSCQANLYRDADLSILTQIAALTATNIERLRLSQTAQASVSRHQDYAERLEILNSIGQQLSSAMTEEYTFNIVA